MIGDDEPERAAHPERLRVGQRHDRSAAVGAAGSCTPGRPAPASARRSSATRTRWRLSNVIRSAPLDHVGGVHRQLGDRAAVERGGEAQPVVAPGDLDLAELAPGSPSASRSAVDGGRRVAHRAEAQRPRADAGAHHEAHLHERERADGRVGEVRGEERHERRDRRVQRRRRERERAVVVDLPVDLQELGVGQLPRGRRSSDTGGELGRQRRDVEGAVAGHVAVYSLKAGMTSRPKSAEALEDLFLRDHLAGVEDEVDEVDAGRLPLLQLADDLLGVADGDALRRLARPRPGPTPDRRVAASRPGDG